MASSLSMKQTSSHTMSRSGMSSARRVAPAVTSRRSLVVRADSSPKNPLAKWSDSAGMPTDDGVFGFTPFAEMWVGRWAQLGFVSSVVVEFTSGRGTLQQVGINSPSDPVLIVLCTVFGGATLFGLVRTINRAQTKKLSTNEIDRYQGFFGLNTEEKEIDESEAMMKRKGDFTNPPNTVKDDAAQLASKANGSPVDGMLASTSAAEAGPPSAAAVAAATAAAAKKAQQQYEDTMYFGADGELAFARNIEVTNGRWAMMGFLAAILVEASNGHGIIGQVIDICKWSGLLGERSGF